MEDELGERSVERPILIRQLLGATDKPETKVTLRYLAHGLSWAPSYRIDISDPKTLALEQHAVVRNELADLTDADVRLISGYPSVQYAHVRSLLAPRTTWASFFSELSARPSEYADATSNTSSGAGTYIIHVYSETGSNSSYTLTK